MIKIKSMNKIASSLFLIFMCAKIIKIGRNGTSRKKAKGKRQKAKGKRQKEKGKRQKEKGKRKKVKGIRNEIKIFNCHSLHDTESIQLKILDAGLSGMTKQEKARAILK